MLFDLNLTRSPFLSWDLLWFGTCRFVPMPYFQSDTNEWLKEAKQRELLWLVTNFQEIHKNFISNERKICCYCPDLQAIICNLFDSQTKLRAGCALAQLGQVRLAGTNTVHFLVSCSCCWPWPPLLRYNRLVPARVPLSLLIYWLGVWIRSRSVEDSEIETSSKSYLADWLNHLTVILCSTTQFFFS